MSKTPTFLKPPVVELVLGAQFSPLTKFTTAHNGLFWNEIRTDGWTEPSDESPLVDQFELFDRARWVPSQGLQLQIKPVKMPSRFMLAHESQDRLLQIQQSRFHLNWRKRDAFYPSYKNLIQQFEDEFARFQNFVEGQGLGKIALNQWELTYIDAFPKGELWETPEDWSKLLPGLFETLFDTNGLGLSLEQRGAEWSYEIQPKRGRLHVVASLGRWGEEKRDCLLLQTTARGPIGKDGATTLREGLDIGHDTAVGSFLRIVSASTKKDWGQ